MSLRTEIESKLDAWAASQVPPIPVAYENKDFAKPTTGSYLQIFFLTPAVVNPDVAAERERETGIFQINICVPQNTGSKKATDLIAALRALFPVLPKTGTVSIERPANVSGGFNRTDGFFVTPVSFSYRQER
jgi:hypothetical protein